MHVCVGEVHCALLWHLPECILQLKRCEQDSKGKKNDPKAAANAIKCATR